MLFAFIFIFINFANASCSINVSLLNQDPYPAVPGDYVKLVFQVQGTESSDCGDISFQLTPQYPLLFDPNSQSEVLIKAGTFVSNYNSYSLIPYKVRVDENAVDGDNPIEVRYSRSENNPNDFVTQQFELNIKEVRTTFETYVSNFNPSTNIMTLQILNSGKSNVDALTLEIPEQKSIMVKGSNRDILGSLDSNEYTTADFEVSPAEANISLKIYYTDQIGVRRTTNSTVTFDPSAFENRKSQQSSSSWMIYLVIIVVLIIAYILYRRYKNGQKKKLHN